MHQCRDQSLEDGNKAKYRNVFITNLTQWAMSNVLLVGYNESTIVTYYFRSSLIYVIISH
jgi:hypothetical protein